MTLTFHFRKCFKNATVFTLVNRLLKNRPVMFMTTADQYLLPDKSSGFDGFQYLHLDANKSGKLTLEEFISYDEMKLSALVGVSAMSQFINDGSRQNRGVQGNGANHEVEGVIIGQVGARFERKHLMEWQDCAVDKEQNVTENGYGKDSTASRSSLLKAWAHMWNPTDNDVYLPVYGDDVKKDKKNFHEVPYKQAYLNNGVYKARIRMSAEVLLIEASQRAKASGKKAYVHVVGLGLGVWQIADIQEKLFVDAYGDALHELPSDMLEDIGYIDFSWINCSSIKGTRSNSIYPNTSIIIRFSRRNLHDPVPEGCLLVCNYAWDSNSAPGEDYYGIKLK